MPKFNEVFRCRCSTCTGPKRGPCDAPLSNQLPRDIGAHFVSVIPLSIAFDTGRVEGGVHHVVLLCEISRDIGTSILVSAFCQSNVG